MRLMNLSSISIVPEACELLLLTNVWSECLCRPWILYCNAQPSSLGEHFYLHLHWHYMFCWWAMWGGSNALTCARRWNVSKPCRLLWNAVGETSAVDNSFTITVMGCIMEISSHEIHCENALAQSKENTILCTAFVNTAVSNKSHDPGGNMDQLSKWWKAIHRDDRMDTIDLPLLLLTLLQWHLTLFWPIWWKEPKPKRTIPPKSMVNQLKREKTPWCTISWVLLATDVIRR